jgi:hypothetical protein
MKSLKELMFLSKTILMISMVLLIGCKDETLDRNSKNLNFDENPIKENSKIWDIIKSLPKVKLEVSFGQNKVVEGVRHECIEKGLCKISISFGIFFGIDAEVDAVEYDGELWFLFLKSSISEGNLQNFDSNKLTVHEDIYPSEDLIIELGLPSDFFIGEGDYYVEFEDDDYFFVKF